MTPGVGSLLIPGAWLAGFIKKTTTHGYIQNIKTLCLMDLNDLFYVFPMMNLERGLYGPQRHDWQDL